MATITFSCPECSSLLRATLSEEAAPPHCPQCQADRPLETFRLEDGRVKKCVACPSTELFIRKDFPQRLGVAIVVIGFALSCVFWARHDIVLTFAVLFLTAGIDVALYLTMGNLLECYRCHAQYRGLQLEGYDQFDHEAFERHRQQEIRLREARERQSIELPDATH